MKFSVSRILTIEQERLGLMGDITAKSSRIPFLTSLWWIVVDLETMQRCKTSSFYSCQTTGTNGRTNICVSWVDWSTRKNGILKRKVFKMEMSVALCEPLFRKEFQIRSNFDFWKKNPWKRFNLPFHFLLHKTMPTCWELKMILWIRNACSVVFVCLYALCRSRSSNTTIDWSKEASDRRFE
jgi:hypothetical protein